MPSSTFSVAMRQRHDLTSAAHDPPGSNPAGRTGPCRLLDRSRTLSHTNDHRIGPASSSGRDPGCLPQRHRGGVSTIVRHAHLRLARRRAHQLRLDLDGPATDNLLVFGWAPIAASEATRLQADLIGQGWLREDGAQGTYITTDPQYAVAVDEDGYGMTYLFGDGWVTLALTKQGLVLIERPDA